MSPTASPSDPMEQLFLAWWNLNQPLFQIQHTTGTKFSREQMIEIKKWMRHAFDEGSSAVVKEIPQPQLDLNEFDDGD